LHFKTLIEDIREEEEEMRGKRYIRGRGRDQGGRGGGW
jgi:hypothetical protein